MKKGKDSFYARYVKRALDIAFSGAAIVVLGVPMLGVAVLVKKDVGSPVLFKQHRIGKNNQEFSMYKFRTMTDERDANGVYLPDDERLTRLGSFLRKTSVDELPSLINVLKGEMSIIGPRPLPTRYLARYTEEQKRRHEVAPGLSNPATTSGRNQQSWEQQFAVDVYYVDNLTFLMDLKSIFQTIKIVLTHEGATDADGDARAEFIGIADINDLQTDAEGNYMNIK